MAKAKGITGKYNYSATSTDEQISKAIMLLEENELYLDEICKETGLTMAILYNLRFRDTSWEYLKEGHDISGYNKFRHKPHYGMHKPKKK